jgi:hypothetical protein
MKVPASRVIKPTAAEHYKAMGTGLVAYHGSNTLQDGAGFWGNAWRFVKPILGSAGHAAASSFLKNAKDGDIRGAARTAATAGFEAAQKSAKRKLAAGDRPF